MRKTGQLVTGLRAHYPGLAAAVVLPDMLHVVSGHSE